jgi:hypothetical protein
MIQDVRFHLDFNEDECFDAENLFIILKYLGYSRLRDEKLVTSTIFPIFAFQSDTMSWYDLKVLLCALEGI